MDSRNQETEDKIATRVNEATEKAKVFAPSISSIKVKYRDIEIPMAIRVWAFAHFPLALHVNKFDEYLPLLSTIRTCDYLWGIEHDKDHCIELITPIAQASDPLELNVRFVSTNGDFILRTGEPSEQLKCLFRVFETSPFAIVEQNEEFREICRGWWHYFNTDDKHHSETTQGFIARSAWVHFPERVYNDPELRRKACHQMNFALRYADESSPIIIVEQDPTFNPFKFANETTIIKNKDVTLNLSNYDDRLVSLFIKGDEEPDQRSRYLTYYHVLEYLFNLAAYDEVMSSVQKIVKEPTLFYDPVQLSNELLGLIEPLKQKGDKEKAYKLIKKLFDIDDIKKILLDSSDAFFDADVFEGGYQTQSVKSSDSDLYHPIANNIVELRNAIVHYDDCQCVKSCNYNETILIKWVWLIRRIAKQAIASFTS